MRKWRSESKRALMYLNDCFGCDATRQKILDMSLEIKKDLISSGFVPKVENVYGCLYNHYSFSVRI